MPLRQVYSPLDQKPPLAWEVDIIAVHGLNAKLKTDREQSEGTWSKGGRLWLRDDLPQRTPNARIFIYEWKSEAIFGGDHSSFGQRATLFLQEIQIERKGAEGVPLIFLGHSLGGLLIEQALVNAKLKEEKYGSIGEATVGIAFFGTPHCGGNKMMVAVGKMATQFTARLGLLKGRSPLENLIKDSQFTETLQDNWKGIAYKWKLVSFWGTKDNIVPKDSSSFDWSEDRETVVQLDADHSNVCKFDTGNNDVDKTNWKLVSFNIEPLYEEAVERGRSIIAAKEAAKAMKNAYIKDESYKRCLKTLHVTDPSDNLTRIQKTKDELLRGTCSWIHDDPAYVAFTQEEQSQTLWIHGNPGKGKTMLAISQVFHLQERLKNIPGTLCYFFCDDKDDRKRGAVAILQSLLHQILDRHPKSFEIFRDDWERQEEKLVTGPDTQVTLWRILESVLLSLKDETIWFVIDALDECEVTTRNILLDDIVKHIDRLNDVTEKWLFTSRNEPSIKELLLDSKEISLESNEKAVTADVQRYIDKKVEFLTGRKLYLQFPGLLNLKKQITKTLQEKSEGTFLWVSLACKQLEEQPPVSAMEVLQELPSDLNMLYAQLLSAILAEKYNLQLVKEILVLVTIALRPLTLYELALLASMDKAYRNDKGTIQQFVDKCGSFITIREDSIYLVHQSAKDFLTSKEAILKLELSTDLTKEHEMMTIRCLKYVCSGIFDDGAYDLGPDEPGGALGEVEHDLVGLRVTLEDETASTKDEDATCLDCAPFPLRYPILAWLAHGSSASADIGDYFDEMQDFFEFDSESRAAWGETCSSMGELLPMPALHLATYFSVVPLVAKVIEWEQYPIDMKDENGQTALVLAVQVGDIRIVRLLLEAGANVNEKGARYRPLRHAMLAGHIDIVRHLLKCGADLSGYNGQSELHWAASKGQKEITKLLLENKADVSAKREDDITPLHDAAYLGHENVVRMLLKANANMYAMTGPDYTVIGPGLTPLHLAVRGRHSGVVRWLLAHEKNDNAKKRQSEDVLYLALKNGDKDIVRLLLKAGADANLRFDSDQKTALYVAAEAGHESVVSLLVGERADIGAKSVFEAKTALYVAAEGGYEGIVCLLLDKGADVESKDRSGMTALQAAAQGGHHKVVSLLLDRGANINLKCNYNLTALQWALAGRRSPDVVQILLKGGISVDTKDIIRCDADEDRLASVLEQYGVKKRKAKPKQHREFATDDDLRQYLFGKAGKSLALKNEGSLKS